MTLYVPPPEPPALIQSYVKDSARNVVSSPESLISSQKLYLTKNEDRSPVNVTDLGLRFPKTEAAHLTAQERQGEKKEFEIPLDDNRNQNNPSQQPNLPANIEKVDVVEVVANKQEYDDRTQVITARGNVVMRFAQATLTADRLQVNLVDRLAVAQGNVILRRGEQVIRGARFEYYFVQDRGKVISASGEVYQPSISQDAAPTSRISEGTGIVPGESLSDRLSNNQPLRRVSGANGYQFVAGSQRDFNLLSGRGGISNPASGGMVNRLRFQADSLDFEGNAWTANKIRITNDPFSPPELEVRADTAKFRQTEPQVNRLNTKGSRVVLDQQAKVPLFANELTFDRRVRQPSLFRVAFDGNDRGGLFLERGFKVINREDVSWEIKPQYFLQRAISGNGDLLGSSVFGLDTKFNAVLDSRSDLIARTSIFGFDADRFEDNIKANVTLARKLGDLSRPYDLKLEYGYRERLFNGSLGFQRVRSRFGVQLDSPDISIADTGIRLKFLGSIQNITAETDRRELLSLKRSNDRTNLTRYLVSATLNKDFPIWQGQALPATKEEGLRFTSTPVLPYVQLITGLTGTQSLYSNGDNQPFVRANIGIEGQFGHFSRSYLDYTGFRIEYAQGFVGDRSPFKFDRFVDEKTISVGIIQQIYGPIRAGIQTSWSLDDRGEISTDYILEYSRRTHKVVLRYNPVLEIGSISFNISDFNWDGNPQPFDNSDI
jgi:lipopolysaccharide export system protein LptA